MTEKFRVLVAGGGVAALESMLALRALAEERVTIDLVAPEPRFWYRPLSVLEPFRRRRVQGLDLAEVAGRCNACFTLDAVESVRVDDRTARLRGGADLEYDALLVATGARPLAAVPGAFTFRGPADSEGFQGLLAQLEAGSVRRLVFAIPGGVAWPLPAYELALLTASWLRARNVAGVEVALVTPEESALRIFGLTASSAVAELLERAGIELRTSTYPLSADGGRLALLPGGEIPADVVVALPRLEGAPPAGIPHDDGGFVATDGQGRISGIEDVFAAGDVTAFPVKQGGLAAQQADAVAEAIAASAGAELTPQPFRPVLRGLLLTGTARRFLRSELATGQSVADSEALWWPPAKIVGRYLAPFLADYAGVVLSPPADAVPVELDLLSAESGLLPVG
jgi:sulfide:quinone oxidoreductase